MISGFFPIDPYYMDEKIKITRQWLEKHLHRSRGKNIKNFICQINNQFLFSLSLWIGENDQVREHFLMFRNINLSLVRSTIENDA